MVQARSVGAEAILFITEDVICFEEFGQSVGDGGCVQLTGYREQAYTSIVKRDTGIIIWTFWNGINNPPTPHLRYQPASQAIVK